MQWGLSQGLVWRMGLSGLKLNVSRTSTAARRVTTYSGAQGWPCSTEAEGNRTTFSPSDHPHGSVTLGTIPFGLFRTSIKDNDTVCITHLKNRDRLRKHPGFNQHLGEKLRKANSKYVDVVPISAKGMALVANCDIPRGLTFVRERPLLTCLQGASSAIFSQLKASLQYMTPANKTAYLALFNCKSKAQDNWFGEELSIMRTNGFGLSWSIDGDVQRAVFDWISRANHSCSPNAVYTWHDETFCGTLRSVRKIKTNEEITIGYIDLLDPSWQRKTTLEQKYSFLCACPACSLPKAQQTESDRRRQSIFRFVTCMIDQINKRSAQRDHEYLYQEDSIQQILDMLDAEGLSEEKAVFLVIFAKIEEHHAELSGDYARAIQLAERAIKELQSLGYDKQNKDWGIMEQIIESRW